MGKKEKTDKKKKTTQVEALRQKYEALLLEDKRRKERNEYILDKMDKMRLCVSLVRNKYKPDFCEHPSTLLAKRLVPVPVTHSTQPCRAFTQEVSPSPRPASPTAVLLTDIYKNFILIPKRTPTLQQYSPTDIKTIDIKTTEVKEPDWKSKYEILNKLKQEEKEDPGIDPSEYVLSEHRVQNDYPKLIIQSRQDASEIDETTIMTSKDDDEKNFTNVTEPMHFDHPMPPDNNVLEEITFESFRSPEEIEVIDKIIDANRRFGDSVSCPKEINPEDRLSKIEGSEKIERLDDDGINPAHISYDTEKMGKPFGDIPVNTEGEQYPIEVINVDDFTPQKDVTVQDGVNVNPEGYGMNRTHFVPLEEDETELEIDTASAPKLDKMEEPNQEDPEMSLAPEKQIVELPLLAPSPHVSHDSPQTALVPEHVEDLGMPNVDSTGVDEIEHEQREMFYPQADQEVVYDQETTENVWNAPQTENIQQNEQYYYEGPHEQPESVHINEHEETSTPYDQNYEQQYAANYEQQQYVEAAQPYDPAQAGYDQSQAYDQESSQVYDQESSQVYDQQSSQVYDQQPSQVYDPQLYDQQQEPYAQYDPNVDYVQQQEYRQDNYETVEQVEKQLDNEQGFVGEQSEAKVQPAVA